MIIKRNTQNLSGTTEKFFSVPAGIQCKILTEMPEDLPPSGCVWVYLREGHYRFLDEFGVETDLSAGEPGPPGPDPRFINELTGEAIGGHRVVVMGDDGKIYYADPSDLSHSNRILGVTTGAAAQDTITTIQTSGILEEPSWDWIMGTGIWFRAPGILTQEAPISGFSLEIGDPLSSTSIFIRIGTPIILAS